MDDKVKGQIGALEHEDIHRTNGVMKPLALVTCQGGVYCKSIGITRLLTDPCSAFLFYRLFCYGCEQQATILQQTGSPKMAKLILPTGRLFYRKNQK